MTYHEMNKPALFQKELAMLLNTYVIDIPVSEIISLYESNFDQYDKLIRPKTIVKLRKEILDNGEMFGIDFPIWYGDYSENYHQKNKIMVVGIDPLRNIKSFNNDHSSMKNDVIIGTPYALHISKMREGKTRVYWEFIKALSEKNFVYLTDIYKFYFFHTVSRLRSYEYFRINNLNQFHIDLLIKEIDLIKPTHIITFGEIAKNMLCYEKSIEIINLIHPAARAQNWKCLKGESATVDNKVKCMLNRVRELL